MRVGAVHPAILTRSSSSNAHRPALEKDLSWTVFHHQTTQQASFRHSIRLQIALVVTSRAAFPGHSPGNFPALAVVTAKFPSHCHRVLS